MKTVYDKKIGNTTVHVDVGNDAYVTIFHNEERIYLTNLEEACDLMYGIERAMYAIKEYLEVEKLAR